MSTDDKPKGKLVVPLGGCKHGMTVAVLGEPDESGRGQVQIGQIAPVRDGVALMPGASIVSMQPDEDGRVRMVEEFTVPGVSERTKTSKHFGFSRKYAESYDNIDWGMGRETDPTVN